MPFTLEPTGCSNNVMNLYKNLIPLLKYSVCNRCSELDRINKKCTSNSLVREFPSFTARCHSEKPRKTIDGYSFYNAVDDFIDVIRKYMENDKISEYYIKRMKEKLFNYHMIPNGFGRDDLNIFYEYVIKDGITGKKQVFMIKYLKQKFIKLLREMGKLG